MFVLKLLDKRSSQNFATILYGLLAIYLKVTM